MNTTVKQITAAVAIAGAIGGATLIVKRNPPIQYQYRTVTRILHMPPMPGSVATNETLVTNTFTIRVNSTSTSIVSTNPPPQQQRTNIAVSFTSPEHVEIGSFYGHAPHGSVALVLAGNWIQSATNMNGPWTNHIFIPAQGSNVSVSFPLDRTIVAKFFRLSTNVYAEITNL